MPPKGSKLAPPPPPPGPLSPAAAQQLANSTGIADFELPKTSLTKLAKGSIPDNVKMQQDVVLALLRSSTLFISYLSKLRPHMIGHMLRQIAAAAHDQAITRSGKSITASDVVKAIIELDFGPADNLVPLLETELAAYRANVQAVKASKVKPPGPGRGRGPRKSNAGQEDLSMGEGGELDDYDDEELGDGDMPGQGDQSVLVDVGGDEDGEDGG